MQVLPTTAPLGAEVRDVDLARLSDEEFRRLKTALDARAILSIRDQKLTPAEQVAFTARLGALQPYDPTARFRLPEAPDLVILSNILEDGVAVGAADAGNSWHTDMPYMERPPAYAALYAVEIPRDTDGEALGATMACSTTSAYDTLDDALKDRLANLTGRGKRGLRGRNRPVIEGPEQGARSFWSDHRGVPPNEGRFWPDDGHSYAQASSFGSLMRL